MDDPEHRLEGWSDKVVKEWRLSPDSNDWHSENELYEMDEVDARAVAVVIGRDPALRRVRPMSRREAWLAGQSELIRVDDWYLPHFMDIEKDGIEVRVKESGLIGFRNELLYGRDEMLYRAQVKNRAGWLQSLAAGTKAYALYNPLMPEKIWLIDKGDGHTLGTCALFNRAPAYDRHAIEMAMGEQAKDLAAKVLPVRGRHQADAEARARRMADNLRVIKAAEAAKADEPVFNDTGAADVLALSSGAAVTVTAAETDEEESFLDRMNHL